MKTFALANKSCIPPQTLKQNVSQLSDIRVIGFVGQRLGIPRLLATNSIEVFVEEIDEVV